MKILSDPNVWLWAVAVFLLLGILDCGGAHVAEQAVPNLTGDFSFYWNQADGLGMATATCDGEDVPISGGCDCRTHQLSTSVVSGNSWFCRCYDGNWTTAMALCVGKK